MIPHIPVGRCILGFALIILGIAIILLRRWTYDQKEAALKKMGYDDESARVSQTERRVGAALGAVFGLFMIGVGLYVLLVG